MVISDLHYDERIFHGIDESRAWEWLHNIVDYHRPDVLLSAGDWGLGINREGFQELLGKTFVLTIYGNHDNITLLNTLYNVKGDGKTPVLMDDGEVYEIGGLRITGINGIISHKGRTDKHPYRRRVEEFLSAAEKLAGKRIDILLMHETPDLPNLFPFMSGSTGSRTALDVIERIKPRVVVNGHMHSGGYKTYTFPFGTKYIYVCSDQKYRHYLILNPSTLAFEIWRDWEQVTRVELK